MHLFLLGFRDMFRASIYSSQKLKLKPLRLCLCGLDILVWPLVYASLLMCKMLPVRIRTSHLKKGHLSAPL